MALDVPTNGNRVPVRQRDVVGARGVTGRVERGHELRSAAPRGITGEDPAPAKGFGLAGEIGEATAVALTLGAVGLLASPVRRARERTGAGAIRPAGAAQVAFDTGWPNAGLAGIADERIVTALDLGGAGAGELSRGARGAAFTQRDADVAGQAQVAAARGQTTAAEAPG